MNKNQTKQIPYDQIYDYLLSKSVKLTDIQEQLYNETYEKIGPSQMISQKDQVRFFEILLRLTGCKKGIEVGTFTGFSSLSFAYALPEDGKLITLDINDEWAKLGEKYWKMAGMDKKIELVLGPALDSLKSMQDQKGTFDFAYIDADKENYLNYYEAILPLLKPNGFILVDNVFYSGVVLVPDDKLLEALKEKYVKDEPKYAQEPEALEKKAQGMIKGIQIIKDFNELLTKDDRIDATILSMADGITLIRKK